MKFKDLSGLRFGKLTVLQRIPNKKGRVWYLCKCDCGKMKEICASSLRMGHSNSCGCLRSELIRKRCRTHGKEPFRLYVMWLNMKERCCSKSASSYKYYGERGITVCDIWKSSFEAFRDWAMVNGYKDNLSIDRIDNNLGYSPENCRFATHTEQMRNTRHNRLYKGKPISQLCEENGLDYGYVRHRLNHYHDSLSKFFG